MRAVRAAVRVAACARCGTYCVALRSCPSAQARGGSQPCPGRGAACRCGWVGAPARASSSMHSGLRIVAMSANYPRSRFGSMREPAARRLAVLVLLVAAQPSAPSAEQRGVGTSWVQVYARPRGPHDACPKDLSGVTGILVSAGFMPVCSVGSSGERMAVTANNIRIAGAHWGAPFAVRLRGGVQGVDSAWCAREVGVAKSKRQARVERGKKLKTIMGGSKRQGRHRKKVALQDQKFKSEWHRQRALQQADRRKARKWARKQANFTSAGPSVAPPLGHDAPADRPGFAGGLPAGPEPASSGGTVASAAGGSGGRDSEAEIESVPSSFLAEMQQREADGDDSSMVVLDGDGNRVEPPSLKYMPGSGGEGASDDLFSHIASDAPLRPYMDAHGNIKWIDRRSSDSKQHGTQMQDAAKLEHLRGGGDWPAQDAHAASRGGALASYGSPPRAVGIRDLARQDQEERRRLLRYDERQVAALAHKVLCASRGEEARGRVCEREKREERGGVALGHGSGLRGPSVVHVLFGVWWVAA